MASAQRLASGSYRTQACKVVNGKKIRKSFTVSPEDFGGDWKKAKNQSELLARNWMFETVEEEKDVLTVGVAIDRYNETRRGVSSPSTFTDYLRMKKYFEPILDVDIHNVTTDMLQNIISRMALQTNRNGQNLTNKTIKNRMFYLLAVLNYFDIDKHFKLTYPVPREKKELLPPEHEEFERLLSMAKTPEDKLILMLAGLYTLRRGEICGLLGEDILWDMHSIRISHSRVMDSDGKWIIRQTPKTFQSIRTIEIAPEYMKLFPHAEPGELVIKKNPNEVTRMFWRLRKRACVNCRFHDLRKFAASTRSDVMPMKYVEADGGWKPGSRIVRTVYDKPFKESRKRYSKEFNEKIVKDFGAQLLG